MEQEHGNYDNQQIINVRSNESENIISVNSEFNKNNLSFFAFKEKEWKLILVEVAFKRIDWRVLPNQLPVYSLDGGLSTLCASD